MFYRKSELNSVFSGAVFRNYSVFLHTIFGNYSEFLGAIFRNYSVINNKKREFGMYKPAMAFNSKLSELNLNISLYLYSSMFLITS